MAGIPVKLLYVTPLTVAETSIVAVSLPLDLLPKITASSSSVVILLPNTITFGAVTLLLLPITIESSAPKTLFLKPITIERFAPFMLTTPPATDTTPVVASRLPATPPMLFCPPIEIALSVLLATILLLPTEYEFVPATRDGSPIAPEKSPVTKLDVPIAIEELPLTVLFVPIEIASIALPSVVIALISLPSDVFANAPIAIERLP